MLVPKVAVQFLRVLGLIVAELAFVRFQFIVLFYVLLEALVTGAGEGTLITAENYSLQVFWQFGTAHFNGDNSLFCGDKLNGKMGIFTDGKLTFFLWNIRNAPNSILLFLVSLGLWIAHIDNILLQPQNKVFIRLVQVGVFRAELVVHLISRMSYKLGGKALVNSWMEVIKGGENGSGCHFSQH